MIVQRAFRIVLLAFPGDVRREHGAEMRAAFENMLDTRVGFSRWSFVGHALTDAVREGLSERWRRVGGRRTAQGTGREQIHGDGRGTMLGDVKDDVRLAFRGFKRARGVSVVIVVTLALGIGGSSAVFSVLRGVLFRPLPFDDAEELVTVRHAATAFPDAGLLGIPGPDLLDYIEGAPSLEGLGRIFTIDTNLNDGQGAARVTMGWVTPDFFDVLGTQASIGRMLDPADWTPRTRVQMEDPNFSPPPMPVMLSHELWRDRFGSDPDLVSRSVSINGTPMNVVGILQPNFRVYGPPDSGIPSRIDAFSYVPLPMTEGARATGQGLSIGRLADGVTLAQARAELERVNESLRETYERHALVGT